MRETHSYWYCFHCQAEISPSCVTNDEHHDLCGHEVYCIDSDISVDRLEELIDAEREGQCVMLPCKDGEKVYYIAFTMQFGYHGVLDGFEHVVVIKQFEYSDIEKFGISVFLTKEQAESKLAEMKGDQNV